MDKLWRADHPLRNVEKKVWMDSQANELATSPFSAPPDTIANHKQFLVGMGHLFGKRVRWNPRYSICLLFHVTSTGVTDRYIHSID